MQEMLRADSDFKIVDKTHQTEQTKQTNEQMEDKTMKETEGLPLPIYIRSDNVQTKTAPIFQAMTLEKGQVVAKEETTLPTLFFMLTGNLKTIPMALWPAERDLPGRCLFLIPSGESFYGKATEPTTLLCCMFHRYYVHLDPAPQTDSANQPDTLKDNVPAVLPLLPALRHEAESTLQAPAALLSNPDYASNKGRLLALLMEHLYTPGELARLLAPILRCDLDFRETVLKNYQNTNRVKDLSKLLNIPPTTFNRKFREAFGIGAKEWFIQKRKEHLLRDILLTTLTLNEIADKYELSPNYLMKVCKDTFHQTFTELRASYAPKWAKTRRL